MAKIFEFYKNHFEIDCRPMAIKRNLERSSKRSEGRPIHERFKDVIEFDNFNIAWKGNVPMIQTPKGKISFLNDLVYFQEEIDSLETGQQGTIDYQARLNNVRYHCRVRFSANDIVEVNGKKNIYMFFFDPMISML